MQMAFILDAQALGPERLPQRRINLVEACHGSA
jgi:hypothetical protein